MASAKVRRQLIRAGSGGDIAAFKAASKSIIEEERQKQHHLLANDLEQILYGESKPVASSSLSRLLPNLPTDKERGLPLLDIWQSQRSLEELVLSKVALAAIEDVLEEHRRAHILRTYGLQPSSKVLFFALLGVARPWQPR